MLSNPDYVRGGNSMKNDFSDDTKNVVTSIAFVWIRQKMKIISLNQRRISQGKNNMSMPKKDLYENLCGRYLKWNHLP